MTTFDKHDDLPYDTHCHLLTLEVWIGNLEDKTIGTPTDADTFVDEGTIDADDAVKAVNALIAATRYLMNHRDLLRARLEVGEDALREIASRCYNRLATIEEIKQGAP